MDVQVILFTASQPTASKVLSGWQGGKLKQKHVQVTKYKNSIFFFFLTTSQKFAHSSFSLNLLSILGWPSLRILQYMD